MKLVTYNTQWCCGLDGVVDPARIVEAARDLADFDVLCLQEVSQGFDTLPGAPGDQPAELRTLLPGFEVFFGAAVDDAAAGGTGRRRFGNLVATRLPVAHVQHHPLPWPPGAGVRSMPRMCTSVTLRDPALGALRVMTTHLEFYVPTQRLAQVNALRVLHAEACAQSFAPPLTDDDGTPFRGKLHTAAAILCGDFNFEPAEPEHAAIQSPIDAGARAVRWRDAWPLVHGGAAHAPTFRVFDRTYGPEPIACDYVFVSDDLAPRLRAIEVGGTTRASDHQPLMVELA